MKKLEAHNKTLQKLLKDKNFIGLEKGMQENATLFDIFSIYSENRVSEFLAWLLAPYEFHGLGTSFISALFNATQSEWQVFEVYNPNLANYEKLSTNEFAMRFEEGTIVHPEYQLPTGSRIDIAVINQENKAAIFIENKVWVGEQKGQTKKYAKEINKTFKEYDIVYIYIDCNEGTAKSDYFYSLNYEWVKEFIEVNSNNTPKNAKEAMLAFKTNFWGETKGDVKKRLKNILVDNYTEFFTFLGTVKQTDINERLQRSYGGRVDKYYVEIDKFLYEHWLAWWYIWANME